MDAQIDQLYDVLLRLDKERENQDLYAWLENICQKQFGLVDGLVANFIDNIEDSIFAKKLLKVLKKLNEHLPELVVSQFMNNQKFPGAIVKYLENTKLQDMAGDAFILLVNVFNDSTIDLVNEKFLQQLIESLEFITDENTQNALVSVLIIICASHEKKLQKLRDNGQEEEYQKRLLDPNTVFQEFLNNEAFYREKLLYLTNRGNKFRFDKCLETVNLILRKDISKNFFNINDMNFLIDICLREIQREKNSTTRVQILKMVETIMENSTYKKYPYKPEDIKDMINEMILYEDDTTTSSGYSMKERELIAKLNIKFQVFDEFQ